jgi:hypothetical protein
MANTMYEDDLEFDDLTSDPVSPAHYKMRTADGFEIQTIDFIRAVLGNAGTMAYCTGSAIKYLSRAGKKQGAPVAQDLRKAAWFCTFAAQVAEENK